VQISVGSGLFFKLPDFDHMLGPLVEELQDLIIETVDLFSERGNVVFGIHTFAVEKRLAVVRRRE
jgi:hypothetical protein